MRDVWEPLRPELDTLPPWDPALPGVTYIVCSTPRSGSGLLCRALASTGEAGTPQEYFNAVFRHPLATRWETGGELHSYVHELQRRRTSTSGVFGTKIHWRQLEELAGEVDPTTPPFRLLQHLFPGARYIETVRADVDRQAISLWTAMHTRVWAERVGAPANARRRVPYSFSGIKRQRDLISHGNAMWASSFAEAGVEPFVVAYEQLAAEYEATVAAAVQSATGACLEPRRIPPPSSRKQGADARSAELLERFRSDLERFPDGSPFRLADAVDRVRLRISGARRSRLLGRLDRDAAHHRAAERSSTRRL
jgi:LPS sulfotransferase NodH